MNIFCMFPNDLATKMLKFLQKISLSRKQLFLHDQTMLIGIVAQKVAFSSLGLWLHSSKQGYNLVAIMLIAIIKMNLQGLIVTKTDLSCMPYHKLICSKSLDLLFKSKNVL